MLMAKPRYCIAAVYDKAPGFGVSVCGRPVCQFQQLPDHRIFYLFPIHGGGLCAAAVQDGFLQIRKLIHGAKLRQYLIHLITNGL